MAEVTEKQEQHRSEEEPRPVQLSQEKLQELIDKAYARGAKNSRESREVQEQLEQLESLKAKNEELQAQVEAANKKGKPNGEADGGGEDVEKMLSDRMAQLNEGWQKKLDAITKELEKTKKEADDQAATFLTERLRSQVVSGASRAGARDPDEVFVLMHNQGMFTVDEDTGKWIVVNDDGKPKLDVDSGGDYLSVEKAVAEFLDQRPHHKRASGRTGGGQGVERGGPADGNIVPLGGRENKTLDLRQATPSELYEHKDQVIKHLRQRGTRLI